MSIHKHDVTAGDDCSICTAREQTRKLAKALENLCGDVYLFSLGEILRSQLMKTQSDGLNTLREYDEGNS